MKLISLKNALFRYSSGSRYILNDISMELNGGHIYGLLGKNGVGKSTMFRVLTGLNRITEGEVEILGMDPGKRSPGMLSEIYLLPEEIHFPDMTIEKYARYYGSFYPNFSMEDLMNYMDAFFITDDVKARASENETADDFKLLRDRIYRKKTLRLMSQGQRKKACVAFALACHTKILLMDEPTNGQDIPGKAVFRRLLESYRGEDNLVVISTHQVRDLEQLIDGVVIINDEHELLLCETADKLLKAFHFGQITEGQTCVYQEMGLHNQVFGISLRHEDEPVQGIQDLDLEVLFNASMMSAHKLREDLQYV